MPPAARTMLLIALVAASSYGGYLLGRSARPEPPPRTRAASRPPSSRVGAQVHGILTRPDALERTGELALLLRTLGPGDLDEVRGAYDALVLDPGDPEIAVLAEWWARFDPAASFEWATRGLRESHPAVLGSVVRAWARRDPQAALAALHGNIRDRATLRTCMISLVRGWEEGGQPGLWDYVSQLPQGTEQQVVIDKLVRRKLARDGVEPALRWVESLPEDERGNPARPKLNARRRLAGAVAEVDPARAVAWVAAQRNDSDTSGMYRRVAMAWAAHDGEAAMRWLESLPPGPERTSAVTEGFRTWVARDRQAAFDWLRGSHSDDSGEWLDPAVAFYAGSLTRTDHREAIRWARRIRDDRRRSQSLRRIAVSWLREDPDGARAWIESAGLSEEDEVWILEMDGRRSRRANPRARADPPADAAPDTPR